MLQFDPEKRLTDDQGNEVRFINHLNDETYVHPPLASHCPQGMLPPEEFELRRVIAEYKLTRDKQFSCGFWVTLLNKPEYILARQHADAKEEELIALLQTSNVYRASMKRILSVMSPRHGGYKILSSLLSKTNTLQA